MKNKICAVIEDLIPSYLEGLTSSETNAFIEENLGDCPECQKTIARLRRENETLHVAEEATTQAGSGESETENRSASGNASQTKKPDEIDYLKKVRNKSRRNTLIVGAFLLLLLTVLVVPTYFMGKETIPEAFDYEIDVTDQTFVMKGHSKFTSDQYQRAHVKQLGATLQLHLYTVPKNPLTGKDDFEIVQPLSEPIDKVEVASNGAYQTVWLEGSKVHPLATYLLNHSIPYVGSVSDTSRLIQDLGIGNRFGKLHLELQTKRAPYGLTIVLEDPMDPSTMATSRGILLNYALLLHAGIDNLGEVHWKYHTEEKVVGSETETYKTMFQDSYTREQAESQLSIHKLSLDTVKDDIRSLQKLLSSMPLLR